MSPNSSGTTGPTVWRPHRPLPADIRAAARTATALRVVGGVILCVTVVASALLLPVPSGGSVGVGMLVATGLFGAFCLFGLAAVIDCLWRIFWVMHKEGRAPADRTGP